MLQPVDVRLMSRPRWRIAVASLDPRRSLAAATGWSIAGVTLAAALVSGLLIGVSVRAAIEREIGNVFAVHAQRLIDTIDGNLAVRRQWVVTTARLVGASSTAWDAPTHRAVLDDLRRDQPEVEWIGVADVLGRVVAASDGRMEGYSVEARPWFTSAFNGPFVDVVPPDMLVLAPGTPGLPSGEHRRLVDMAAPLTDRSGQVFGILGVSLGWSWIETLRSSAAAALHMRGGVEILLVARDGTVLSGVASVPAGSRYDLTILPADARFDTVRSHLVGVARSAGHGGGPDLGWSAIVREPAAEAFEPAYRASLTMFLIVTGSGLVASIIGALIARRIMRRLKGLARAADDVRIGRIEALAIPAGRDEASRIGRSLASLVAALQSSNERLSRLNEQLDRRVDERTREIARMSEEIRSAAILRERLRLARDLHDTLAHSLLALVTQIRLVRKLAATSTPDVTRELDVAEVAAREGLDTARNALSELRASPVRNEGLGAALDRLAARTRERTGAELVVEIDPQARPLADSRTEIAYRILEEAMRNVERHAGAKRVEIRVRAEGGRLDAWVRDDGCGFDMAAHTGTGHYGLVGVQEQAELIGADVTVESAPGRGTTLTMSMPQ